MDYKKKNTHIAIEHIFFIHSVFRTTFSTPRGHHCKYICKSAVCLLLLICSKSHSDDDPEGSNHVAVNTVRKKSCVPYLFWNFVLKLSTPRNLALSNFSLFQPNAHNMLTTYIYLQLPATCFGVVTPSSGRTFCSTACVTTWQKAYSIWANDVMVSLKMV